MTFPAPESAVPQNLRLPIVGTLCVVGLLSVLAGCASGDRGSTVIPPEAPATARAEGVAAPTRLDATSAAGVTFQAYTGERASDPRLPALRDRLAATVATTLDAAEDRAGITFLTRREAVVVLADEGGGYAGNVTVRMLDGVRRPVIRVPVGDLLSGAFLPDVHFPALVVEAAVVASAGDRSAPAWLRRGLGVELAGAFERVLHERALGGVEVRTDPTALFPPSPSGDDPLRAAARVRALERIARGERALARFVVARLEGRSEPEALAEVGVQDVLFLDAAAETERDRALESVEGLGLAELAAARTALLSGELTDAVGPASSLEADLREGRLSRFLAADAGVVLAEFLERRGDAAGARDAVAPALGDPVHLIRVRQARLVQARAAGAAGAAREAARLFRTYAEDYPGAPGSAEALEALGVAPELAEAVPGIAAEIASDDVRVRQRAALRLGETGDPIAATPLRELIGDADADVRRLSYAALALVLGEEAVEDLASGTRDADGGVRGAALSLLAFADPERGEARARELEGDASSDVRAVVDRILAPVRAADEKSRAAAADAEREKAAAVAEAERARLRRVADEARRKAEADAALRAAAGRAAAERAARERGAASPPRPVQPRPPAPPRPDRTKPPSPVRVPPTPVRVPPVPPVKIDRVRTPPLPLPTPPRPLPTPETDQPDPGRKPPPPKPPQRSDDPARRTPPPPAPAGGAKRS